jgi:hypothetical protein
MNEAEKIDNQQGNESLPSSVSKRTYHFMDWVNGDFVDEMIVEINRETAISIMKQKYPNHEFAYVCELS